MFINNVTVQFRVVLISLLISGTIVLLFHTLYAYRIASGNKSRYLHYIYFLVFALFWYLIVLASFFVKDAEILLILIRVIFSMASLAYIFGACLLSNFMKQFTKQLKILIVSLSIVVAGLIAWPLLDPYVIETVSVANFPYIKIGLGSHMYLYIVGLSIAGGLLLGLLLTLWKRTDSDSHKERLKIIASGFILAIILVFVVNILLPYLGITNLIEYGFVATFIILLSFYIALGNTWIYSMQYLLAKNLIFIILGIVLFFMVKGVEFLMVFHFGWDITDLTDVNAMVFGGLLGVVTIYLVNIFTRYWLDVGFAIMYPKYYWLKKNLYKIVKDSILKKQSSKVVLRSILSEIAEATGAENVCFFEQSNAYHEAYVNCLQEVNVLANNPTQFKETLKGWVFIPLLRGRYLLISVKKGFIPRELVEVIRDFSVSINAFINLDITNKTLKEINTKLSKAVVVKTNKLKSVIKEYKEYVLQLKKELSMYKQNISHLISDLAISTNGLQEYEKMVKKFVVKEYEALYALNKLELQISKLKGVAQKLLIFVDIFMLNTVKLKPGNLKVFVKEILDAWRPRFENKSIGLIDDLDTSEINMSFDHDKMAYLINSVLAFVLTKLNRGYVQVIVRDYGLDAFLQFKIVETKSAKVRMLDKQKNEMKTMLLFIEKIVKLHKGVVKYEFDKDMISNIEITMPKL